MAIIGGDRSKSIFIKFMDMIKDYLTEEKQEQRVIEDWSEKILSTRSLAIVQGLENVQKLYNDLNKINRPDETFYTSMDKSTKTERISEVRMKEIDRMRERIDKYERAIEKALKGEMKDVLELNQQSSSKDKGSGGGKGSEGAASETS